MKIRSNNEFDFKLHKECTIFIECTFMWLVIRSRAARLMRTANSWGRNTQFIAPGLWRHCDLTDDNISTTLTVFYIHVYNKPPSFIRD
jgi:hypothetical protein